MPTPPSERRLHPVSFAFAMASHVRQLLLPGLLVLFAGARSGENWQIWAMLLFVPYAIASIIGTRAFRYELGSDELIIRSGVIVRQQRHVPYQRIQNIDGLQNIVHRLLGVIDVRLETAGGEEPEAHLSVISHDAFEELRRHVDNRRSQVSQSVAPAASSAPQTIEPETMQLLALAPRELALCGLIQGRGLLAFSALFGILWESGLFDRVSESIFGSGGGGVVRQLIKAMFGQGVPPLRKIGFTVAAFALLLIAMRALSMVWALIRLHGFTVTKTGDDLKMDFGMFTRVAATIPIRRIQSVTVLEGPWHRLFGRLSVHVNTAGGEGDAVRLQREWLAPVIRPRDVPRVLREVVPSIEMDTVTWQPVDPRGVRRARVIWLVIAAVASVALAGMLQWRALFVFVAVAAFGEVDARKSVGALGWSMMSSGFIFRSGWLWRRQTFAPFSKIQAVLVHETPFDRRHAMARLEIDTAGTSHDRHHVRLPYLTRAASEMLAAQLSARAARTTFHW